jgi:hypothetical protein
VTMPRTGREGRSHEATQAAGLLKGNKRGRHAFSNGIAGDLSGGTCQ